MITFNVKADTRAVEHLLAGIKKGTPKAVSRALNRTITSVQSAAVKAIAADFPIRQKVIRAAMRLRKANTNDLTAYVAAKGVRIPLIDLSARQTRRGVTYKVKRSGRQSVPGAFIAVMKSGHRGVFRRAGKKRLPIIELRGPSIPKVFVADHVSAQMDRVAREQWTKNIKHEVQYLLSKAV